MSSAGTSAVVNNPFAHYISQIDSVSIEDLIGEIRLGSGNSFREAREPFEAIKDFVDQLRFLEGTGIPNRMLSNATGAFQEVLSALTQIKNYNPANYGNPNQRPALVQQLRSAYDKLVEMTLPVLFYNTFRASGLKTVQEQTQALALQIEKERDELRAVVNESKALLAGQKAFSAKIAVAGYGTLFAKEAKEHGDAATRWLFATGAFALATAIAAWINYRSSVNLLNQVSRLPNGQVPSFPASLTVQFTIAKIILLTIGLSAAYWSARVYRSHRHNSIVNKHRANALTSFQEFVVSATDPEVKNAVLLQTTSCIYAPQSTGFSSSNDTDGESPLKILEIVRNFQK